MNEDYCDVELPAPREEPEKAALRKLMKESAAILALAEPELRDACGHTNVAVFKLRIEEAAAALSTSSPVSPEPPQIATVKLSTGRMYLDVCGVAVAMEGDPCRDPNLPNIQWTEAMLREAATLINAARPSAAPVSEEPRR